MASYLRMVSDGMPSAESGAMDILTWLIVGLVAGVLADLLVGGYGILMDIVVGIVGAFIGGWVFARAGWHAPFAGLGGTMFVAFIGAVLLLLVLRLLHRTTYRRL
jgi:uncharacterized membrane protein YeaQ/YmgE (transglycosylase-associated protein family)